MRNELDLDEQQLQNQNEDWDEEPPTIAELLSVDAEYRQLAAAGRLHRIAPKRFNPNHEAWLPVLNTERGTRRYTALFSNTEAAHAQGTTDDWVVLYYYRHGEPEGQTTVITAEHGPLHGLRLIPGREPECREYYREQGALHQRRAA